MIPRLIVAIGCLVLLSTRAAAQVRISEFVARNNSGIVDADGAHSDWIELENTSAGAVNLAGWSLTNQVAVPGLWTFPAVTLPTGGLSLSAAPSRDCPIEPCLGGRYHLHPHATPSPIRAERHIHGSSFVI